MNRLSDDPTFGEVKAFLAAVEPKADADKPSKSNPALTRYQAWEIFANGLKLHQEELQDSNPVYPLDWKGYARRVHGRPVWPTWKIIVRNINREFGSRRRG